MAVLVVIWIGSLLSLSLHAQVFSRKEKRSESGDIRLVGGHNEMEGRVEVFLAGGQARTEGEWGTVCDDSWGRSEAEVVCKQLGLFDPNIVPLAVGNAYFGEGDLPILLDDVICNGSENGIAYCNHSVIGTHDCKHSEDAGVICQGGSEDCTDNDVRLLRGDIEGEGVVQICYKGLWGTVCDSKYATTWNNNSANVVCRQLGFLEPNQIGAVTFQGYPLDEKLGPILLYSVHCKGGERSLNECKNYTIGDQLCPPGSRYGAVKCPRYDGGVNGTRRVIMDRMSDGSKTNTVTVVLSVVLALAALIIVALVALIAVLLRVQRVTSHKAPVDLHAKSPVHNNVAKPSRGYVDMKLSEQGHHTWPRRINFVASASTPGVYEEIPEPPIRQEQATVSCSYVYEDMSGPALEGCSTGDDVPGWVYEEMTSGLPEKCERLCDAATQRHLSESSAL